LLVAPQLPFQIKISPGKSAFRPVSTGITIGYLKPQSQKQAVAGKPFETMTRWQG